MKKKLTTMAMAGVLTLPNLAAAGVGGTNDRIAELEKQMAEMARMFNGQMQAMQNEIATLKGQNEAMSKDIAKAPAATEAGSEALEWAKKVSLGGEVTFRGYNIQNVWDFNDNSDGDNFDLFRVKGSLWADFKATDDVTVHLKATNQNWGEGVTYDQSLPNAQDSAMDNSSNKLFLDNAYINVKNLLGLPVEGTFGRQNLIYGSGFVILDGQSQFSSSSIYFDGVKLSWQALENVTLDAFYLKDQENNMDNSVNSHAGDDITLSGFYLTNKKCAITGMQQELYALNRHDEAIGKDIWMYGARLSDKLANGIDYSAEGAIQTGDATKTLDQDAYGIKLDAGYTFKNVAMTPRLYAGYAFMSGDGNANDGDNEQWDVFYGGWPQWGDLLAWKYLNLRTANNLSSAYNPTGVNSGYDDYSNVIGEAVFSNLQITTIGASANLTEKLSANLSYSDLSFDETAAGIDDDFGDMYQATLKYQYNKYLSFSLYGALLDPGKAFATDDEATEIYWETSFRF